jgi:hypothetical protein
MLTDMETRKTVRLNKQVSFAEQRKLIK